MKKMTKRMLSMFLAAVMVFTTVPFTALTALAKRSTEPASRAYLTTGIDSAFSNTGVTWDSTEKAAKFTGGTNSFLQLGTNPLSDVTDADGFMISVDVKKDASCPDNGRIYDINDGSTSNTFALNGGSDSTNNWRRGMTLAKVNNAECSYYSNDLGDATMCAGEGTGWTLESGVWHNITVWMPGDDKYYYFIDGAYRGSFVANYYDSAISGDRANGVSSDAIKGAFASMNSVRVGKSIYNDSGFVGYIKNLQFISYANAAANIKTAMAAYEGKMADGKVYKNLSNGYTAYQKASANYDAYIYGEATNNGVLNNATNRLVLADAAMQPWVEYSGTANMYFGTIATGAYSNVLYAPGEGTGAMSFSNAPDNNGYNRIGKYDWGNKYTYYKGAVPSSAVFYYNGSLSDIYFPVGFEAYANNDNNTYRTINWADFNGDANIEVTRYWYGYQQGWNGSYGIDYVTTATSTAGDANDGNHCSIGYSSSNTKSHSLSKDGASKNRFWVNIGHIKALASNNTLSKTSITFRLNTNYQSGTSTAISTGLYVVNYYQLTQAIKNNKSKVAGIDVTNYKEGGLAAACSTYDAATSYRIESTDYSTTASTYYTNAQASCTTLASNLGSIATPAVDSNYKAIKNAIDYSGTNAAGENTSVIVAESKRTANSTTTGENNGGYIKGLYKTFALAYDSAKSAMAALMVDDTAYPSTSVSATGTALQNAFLALDVVDIDQPVITPVSGRLLGPTDTISITNPEYNKDGGSPRGSTAYTVAFSDSSASITGSITGSTASATVTPFSGKTAVGLTATVTATASATLSGDSYSRNSDSHTYTLYTPPTVDCDVNYNEGVEITSTNAQTGTIQYSLDNSTWTDYNPANKYKPFTGNTASTVDFYVRETKTLTDSNSASYTVTSGSNHYILERNADFDIKAKYTDGSVHEKGANFYDADSHFVIENAGTYNANITYSLYIDGTLDNSYTYNKTNGIAMTSAIENASFIKIVAFATDRATGSTKETEKTFFNAANFNPMIFRESFDTDDTDGSVKVENSKLWKKDGSYQEYAVPSGTISLEDGAGTKSSSTESHSWRNNVLKINANSTAPGPVVTFNTNPLADGVNATAIRSEGVTISFWRHIEDTSGNTVDLPSTGDNTGYPWRNAIAFQKHNDNTKYYIIEVNGVNSHRIDGSNYTDFVPENQDNTGHEEGNNNGEWEHVAVTINPNTGIKVYTNGVEHDTKYIKIVRGGTDTGATTTDHDNPIDTTITASAAQDLLDFLTAGTTDFTLDNGVMYEGNEYNLFLDDIRIYAQTLTQVEVNNMYTDEYADVQTNITSNSHDPTTVTVYTLASAIGGKAAGSKVGQEFIDYYEVTDAQISNIEYYSFGTGMTVYKAGAAEATYSGDTQIQWNVLGDSQGRCGYQNEELFGAKYTTALSEVRSYLGVNLSTGAGYLVWAPHVMYNLTLNKWVYYAAMSSWGSPKSATFYATSDNPISGYAYQGIIYKSSIYGPNAIDSCIYYGYDSNHKPIPGDLYMVIGSWTQGHLEGRYDAIYGTKINANGSAPAALTASADTLEEPGVPNSSGVNSYALVRGNTPDLEGGGASPGSGEGAYVQYINGYYYLFVSYGQNEGTYTQRVFRATTPLGTDKTNAHINTYTEYTGVNGFQANDDRVRSVLETDSYLVNWVRGNQILSPFDISIYNKIYRSTGHNSTYKAKNADGDWVWVNAVHARPNASKSHGWAAVQDNALAKRQSGGVKGNVCFNNMLGVSENGWLVMFPYQYNGTDSIYKEIKASDLEGLYGGNNMRQQVNSEFGAEYQYTILANLDDVDDSTGVIFGVRGEQDFRMKFKLVRNREGVNDNVQYIRLYNDSATYAEIEADIDPVTVESGSAEAIHEGVVGVHKKGSQNVIMLATLNINMDDAECGLQYWAYRMSDIPDVDKVISHGDFVSMDGVIYTHASDAEVLATYGATAGTAAGNLALKSGYSLYGQEISNNYNYGQKNASGEYISGGERYTTLTTKFPASVDINKVGNILSLNDTEYCRTYGESGSNMRFVEMTAKDSGSTSRTGWWCTKNADGTYTAAYATDEEAKAAVDADPTLELYKTYGIEGKVSSFFRYYDNETDGAGQLRNGYPKVGVTLVVAYKDIVTGADYSEFEFCYVMPNPAWAHTIAATKNTSKDTGNNRQSSYGIFNRFEGSYGEATDYSSSFLYYSSTGNTSETGWGYGTSGYLTDFSSQSFSDTDLDTLNEIKTLMNKSPNAAAGVNSGSFAAWTHNDKYPNAYTANPQLINTQYYVDYSDKSNYIKNNPNTGLITSGSNNTTDTPTGYQFKMRTSNFLWENYSESSILDVTSYAKNDTGLSVSYSSTAAGTQPYNKSTQDGDYNSEFTAASIYDTNYQEIKTQNKTALFGAGRTAFKGDGFLFMTDERSSNALFDTTFRNKLLYYFSSGTNHALVYPEKDTANNRDYLDGTDKNGTPQKIYDFRQNEAYHTAANGKGSTNSWQGTATFTGKDTLKQNTVADLQTIGNASSSDTLVYENGRLYDGYYYYTDGHTDSVPRETWTASEQTAYDNRGVNGYGRIDVTAENMANYILELGNYHKVDDIGIDGGRFVGNDTYHYYNIGVATCDKGAARDFLENFSLKRLRCEKVDGKRHVILDANGRPTVETRDPSLNDDDENFIEDLGDAQGNLYVEDTSAKSYRDYINAVARLEWFVQNPQNTVQDYLKGEEEYESVEAIQSASGDDYTTAYTSGNAIYKADVTNTDIFGTGTTSTDEVQAQLIADVIEAYENLYTVDDYREVEKEYKQIKAEIDADIAAANGNYTQESIDNYNNAFIGIAKAVAYYTTEGGIDTEYDSDLLDPTDFDNRYNEDFWRYSDYSGADYDTIRAAMREVETTLMPKVDTSVLSATAAAKAGDSENPAEGTVRFGIYETVDGNYVQTKRADEWYHLYDKIVEADGVPFSSGDGVVQDKAPNAMYVTTDTKYIDAIIGTTEREKEGTKYPYEIYRQTIVPSGTAGTATTYVESGNLYVDLGGGEYAVVSDDQKEVNTENHELDAMSISDVDVPSAYESYNAVYKVVDESLVMDKYLEGAQTMINNAKATRNDGFREGGVTYGPVYGIAASEDVTLYAAVTGKTDFSAGTELKVTGIDETDPITTKVLETASLLEDSNNKATYVKMFNVAFTVKTNDTQNSTESQNVYYGEPATFNIPNGAQYNSTFSITYLAGLYDDIGAATSSAKFSYAGTAFTKVATSNMSIVCKMKEVAPTTDYKKVEIRDIYGTVVNVFYVAESDLVATGETTATITFGSSGFTATAASVPFYTFSSWERLAYTDTATDERVYSYTPKYNAGEEISFTVESGATVTNAALYSGTTYKTAYDTLVTIDASEISGFYAWATVDSVENKYQIASYEGAYSFYAIVPEDFVVVKKVGNAYKVGDTTLTAANVDTAFNIDYLSGNTAITDDVILKNKLDGKAPFISLIKADLSNSNKQANVYCRVTTGASTPYSEVGVLATNKAAYQGDKASMVVGTASLFKTSTVSPVTGQFTYSISKASGFTSVTFRGYLAYTLPFWYGDMDPETDDPYRLNVSETSENILVAATA